MVEIKSIERITLIDALRGVTLLGILIVHTKQIAQFSQSDFNLYILNSGIHYFVDHFMEGKFYTVFNVLFGVSFYIIISRAKSKGLDYRFRFVWRMIILIFIGYLHELIYTWEALVEYGIIGILLIFFYNIDKKRILIIAICCLAANTIHHEILHSYNSEHQPVKIENLNDEHKPDKSFKTFFSYHVKHSFIERQQITLKHPFNTLGLFLLGLFLGKMKFFEKHENKKHLYWKIFGISSGIFAGLYLIHILFYEYKYMQFFQVLQSYGDYFFTSLIISGFILLYSTKARRYLDYFIPYGKMGLSNYIFQSIFALFIFQPFFWGLYKYSTALRILIVIINYVFQLILCTYWLKYFRYGPVEYFWRSATNLKWMSNRLEK